MRYSPEDLLRARTLGFLIPRPGTRPSPRMEDEELVSSESVGRILRAVGHRVHEVISVTRCISRRRVVLVRLVDDSFVLLKWPDEDIDVENNYETTMLGLLDEVALPPEIRAAIPRILAVDPQTRVVVVDAIPPCPSLHDLLGNERPVPEPYLRALARILASLHGVEVRGIRDGHHDRTLGPPVPRDTLVSTREYANGCGLDFDDYLRSMQELEPRFRELHDRWTPNSLIHFDLGGDNVLFPVAPSAGALPVRLIDWELAGFGDPMYDVGFLVGQLFLGEMRRVRFDVGATDWVSRIQANAHDFMSAYSKARSVSEEDVRRLVQYAGIALLVHSTVRLQQIGALGRIGHLCLHFGKRFVQHPDIVSMLLSDGRRRKGWVG
ncbi:phosphotransferase family protein [Streptosporangium sp. CA-135522]|uniref:phosphotransferase family protein n=1 Tax=Streptosporangium sp. CA-135522 TaxID=3240072 RepID=UPI003D8F9EB8